MDKKEIIVRLIKKMFERAKLARPGEEQNGLCIYLDKKTNISSRQLNRLYSRVYIEKGTIVPNNDTLDEIATYVGYTNYDHFRDVMLGNEMHLNKKQVAVKIYDSNYGIIINRANALAVNRVKSPSFGSTVDYIVESVKREHGKIIDYDELAQAMVRYILKEDVTEIPSRTTMNYVCLFIGFRDYTDFIRKLHPVPRLIDEDIAKFVLNPYDANKESKKDEWMVYEVAFLWFGFAPPSEDDHWSFMTKDIWLKKIQIHRNIDNGKLQMTKENRYKIGKDLTFKSKPETIVFDPKDPDHILKKENLDYTGMLSGKKQVGLTRYLNREELVKYALSLRQKPKFLFY